MNQSRKLELSKETLRCLDDEDLTDVVGGGNGGCGGEGGGGGPRQSDALICISQAAFSCVCLVL